MRRFFVFTDMRDGRRFAIENLGNPVYRCTSSTDGPRFYQSFLRGKTLVFPTPFRFDSPIPLFKNEKSPR